MKSPSDIVKESEAGIVCKTCDGAGYTAEHDSPGRHGEDGECVSCPVQAPCEDCRGEGGGYLTISTLRSLSLSLLQSVEEWVEPKKFPERESDEYDAGYKRALDDLSAFISEEIKKLK